MDAILPVIEDLPPRPEWGPKMAALRSDRHRRFVWAMLCTGGNQGVSARKAGFADSSDGLAARVQGHRLMQQPLIVEALNEVALNDLRGMAVPAINALKKLIGNDKHPQHAKAIDMVLARIPNFTERYAVDHHHRHEVMDHAREAVDQLRMLKGLGVDHDKLIEVFGYSGLAHYERMLAAQDLAQASEMKLIGEEKAGT